MLRRPSLEGLARNDVWGEIDKFEGEGYTRVPACEFFNTKEDGMLKKEMAEMFKGATGLSDGDMAKLHPGLEKLINNVGRMMENQLVAEVVKSEACFAQVKVGDKLVFDPFLNPEKSTGVMCPKALLPVLLEVNALWEMQMEWAESGKKELPEIVWRNVRCLDPGLEDGGVGGVVYRIHAEKMVP